VGLLRFAHQKHVERLAIVEEEVPFTSEGKYMRTNHGAESFLKGAPERIIELCTQIDREAVARKTADLANRGLRVLAMAVGRGAEIRFVGLIGMEDPPRENVHEALMEARHAGIRTIMITGDSVDTARSIANRVGIKGDALSGAALDALTEETLRQTVHTVSIYARVSPQHKIQILQALQQQGEIVAMTGDGVNDAPALKAAHVGIAMGKDGTEVARQAASMILTDDNYATIVRAIREGRRIYDNIRKFILYLVRANLGQMLLFTLTVVLGMPLPLLPIHILWINLMTDGLPALALGMEREEPGVMLRKPRPKSEQLFTGEWAHLITASLTSCLLTFLIFTVALAHHMELPAVRTLVFTFSIFFELLLAFHSRSHAPLWNMGALTNRWLLWATAVPLILQLILLFTPLSVPFGLRLLPASFFMVLLMIGALGFGFLECIKLLRSRHVVHARMQ
jgi:Ca2+-transporting ATPase